MAPISDRTPAMTRWIPFRSARFWVAAAILVGLSAAYRSMRRPREEIAQIRARLTAQGVPLSLEELENEYSPVPDGRNAAFQLVPILSRFPQIRSPESGSSRPRSALAADEKVTALGVEAAFQQELHLIHELLSLPDFWVPGWKTNLDFCGPAFLTEEWLLRIAEVQIDRGQVAAGISSLVDAFKLADIPYKTPGSIVPLLKLYRCNQAAKAVEILVNSRPLPRQALDSLDGQVEPLLDRHDVARSIQYGLLFAEWIFNQKNGVYKSAGPRPFPEALQRRFGDWSYVMIGRRTADRLDLLRANSAYLELSKRSTSELIGTWTLPGGGAPLPPLRPKWDPYGSLHDSSLQTWIWIRREAVLRTRALLTHVGLAVERYRRDHQEQPPDSLDALVPNYLSAVPTDPFGNGPLHYQRLPAGFRIYSVGTNLRDDGGVPVVDEEAFDAPCDLTFTVEN